MQWSTPSFQEIKMDAEARGYSGWVDNPDAPSEVAPLASSEAEAKDDGTSARG